MNKTKILFTALSCGGINVNDRNAVIIHTLNFFILEIFNPIKLFDETKIFLQGFLRHYSGSSLLCLVSQDNVKKFSQHKGPHVCPYKHYTNPEKSYIIHTLSITFLLRTKIL